MKKVITIFLIAIVMAAGIGLAIYINKKNETDETNQSIVDKNEENEEEISKKDEESSSQITIDESEEPQEEQAKENEEVQTPEEKQEEDNRKTIEEKAIEAVKKEWWGDSVASFSVDNSANLPDNQCMVKVTQDAATFWFVVDTESWEVSEY